MQMWVSFMQKSLCLCLRNNLFSRMPKGMHEPYELQILYINMLNLIYPLTN